MLKERWLLFVLALLLAVTPVLAKAPETAAKATPQTWETGVAPYSTTSELDEIMWMEDWEAPDVLDHWTGTDPLVQDNYWQVDDWEPFEGNGSWRCFDPNIGDPEYGGYGNDWLQVMQTAAMDVSGHSALDLEFWFRINAEEPDWDGANVWVFAGDSPGDWSVQEVVTPTSPAYTENDINGFNIWFAAQPVWPGWSGRDGNGFDDYTLATFDLDSYAQTYDYVSVAFVFGCDHFIDSFDYPQMFGWQLDNIEVTGDGGQVLWADDADGTNIGGAPTFVSGTAASPTMNQIPMVWDVLDVGAGNAISGSQVVGIEDVPFRTRFNHYFESEPFDLPELEDGQDYYLDTYFRSEFQELDDPSTDNIAWWRVEVFVPSVGDWVAASNVDGANNYIYGQETAGEWWLFSEMFAERWDMNTLSGQEGIKIRCAWHSPDAEMTFDYFWMDDLIMHKEALEYDVQTMLVLPYPATVGVPVYGNIHIYNNGGSDATAVLPLWQFNGATYPSFPSGAIDDLVPGDTDMTRWIDVPGDADEGFWTPLESQLGDNTLTANAVFAADEIPEDNTYPTEVIVEPDGRMEVGMDTRNFFGSLSIHDPNTGPVVKIDPMVANEDMFGGLDDYDIQQLNVRGWFWNADGSTGGAPANPQLQLTVYGDGDTPGTELWSGLVDVTMLDGSAISEGYDGDCMVAADVSGIAALQDLTGPFWVGVTLTMMDVNGVYPQPLINRTGPYDPWQAYQFNDLDDANSGTTIADWGHHISAVLAGMPAAVEPVDNGALPKAYVLDTAYPNPFNPTTTLRYALPTPGEVRLTVVNSLGQEVARLVDGSRPAGDHTVVFDGSGLASGVYLVHMTAGDFAATQKVVLMK